MEVMDAIFSFTSKERYGVTSLSFIVINNNNGDFQIETQLRKNVNKYTNIIIISVIYCSHCFSIVPLNEKIMLCFDLLYIKIKVTVFKRVFFIIPFFIIFRTTTRYYINFTNFDFFNKR